MADPGQPPTEWLTLSKAAARTGHTRETLRQRVRRGKLAVVKGNDGLLRVHVRDLADLPPPDESAADPGQPDNTTLANLVAAVADLHADIGRTRMALGVAAADRGQVAAAEAMAAAETRRADVAEARLTAAEARAAAAETALAEARTPWAVRIVRAWRRMAE